MDFYIGDEALSRS
jgi:actin-related protein 3